MKTMLKRVRIKGYKSLADVDVTLGTLCALFGSNAAGKSNFLDALQLLLRIATSRTLKDVELSQSMMDAVNRQITEMRKPRSQDVEPEKNDDSAETEKAKTKPPSWDLQKMKDTDEFFNKFMSELQVEFQRWNEEAYVNG